MPGDGCKQIKVILLVLGVEMIFQQSLGSTLMTRQNLKIYINLMTAPTSTLKGCHAELEIRTSIRSCIA